jgi:hypothetical protein
MSIMVGKSHIAHHAAANVIFVVITITVAITITITITIAT